jgi:hypothetical protein
MGARSAAPLGQKFTALQRQDPSVCSFSLQENDFRDPHICVQYMCSRARRRLWTTGSSPFVEGAATSPPWDRSGASWAIGRRPIEEPVDLVIQRGQCCRQLAGAEQGAEHQLIGNSSSARANKELASSSRRPAGEDPPPPEDDDLVCGEGHLAHEVARDEDGQAFAGAVGRQSFPVPNRLP